MIDSFELLRRLGSSHSTPEREPFAVHQPESEKPFILHLHSITEEGVVIPSSFTRFAIESCASRSAGALHVPAHRHSIMSTKIRGSLVILDTVKAQCWI